MYNQNRGREAYLCVFDPRLQEENVKFGTPSSTRIIQDILRIHEKTLHQIYLNRGVALEGRIWRRWKSGVPNGNHGGKRTKAKWVGKWMHRDAETAFWEKMKNAGGADGNESDDDGDGFV